MAQDGTAGSPQGFAHLAGGHSRHMAPTVDKRVTLGRSGLEVSPIAFGTWQLGGEWGSFDEQRAIAAIRHAHGLGINFFDTAQAYGFGASERLLAKALADQLRDDRESVVIATKGGLRPVDGGVVRDSSPEWLRQGVEESLEALGVEWIDLYQVHWPDPDTPFEETAAALVELREEGKIRHVGVSNFSAAQLEELSEDLRVETLQPPYHLFAREVEESVLPWCAHSNVGVLVYSPLAHGLLTGAIDVNTEFADDDWRSNSPLFAPGALRQNLEVVRQLEGIASQIGCTLSQLAIAWVLSNDAVDVAIVGSRRPEHIEESVGALDVRLGDREWQWIAGVMEGAVTAPGPSPELNSDT